MGRASTRVDRSVLNEIHWWTLPLNRDLLFLASISPLSPLSFRFLCGLPSHWTSHSQHTVLFILTPSLPSFGSRCVFFCFFFFNVILFIYFWLPWVFVVGHGLLIAVASCWGAQALGAWASAVVAHRLSCPYGIWNLPWPGIKPVSPALAGGFLHPLRHQGGPGPVLILGEDYTVLSSFYTAKTVLLYINISMRKVFFLLFYRWRTWDAEK